MAGRLASSLLLALWPCIFLLLLHGVSLSAAIQQQEDNLVVQCPSSPTHSEYVFTRRIPEGCVQSDCDYFVGIGRSSSKYLLDITLEGRAEGWLAVGFSKSPSMYAADVVGCSRHTDGLVAIIDTWNSEHFKTNVMKEPQDDICHYSAGYDNGRMYCSFSRTTRGSSFAYDYNLSSYHYLLFGSGESPRESFSSGFTYHSWRTPVISESMINPATGDVMQVATPTAAEEVEVGGVSQDLTAHVTTATVTSNSEIKDSVTTTTSLSSPHVHEEAEVSSCPPFTSYGSYRLTHRIPAGCNQSDCDYFLGINNNHDNDDLLDFTLEGRVEGWIAVGFSQTPNMASSDVLGCIRYGNGVTWAIDTWNADAERTNTLDETQVDVCVHSVSYHDGRLQCRFSRSITGASNDTDLNLDGDYYLLFGRGERRQNNTVGGGFSHHDNTPQVSVERLNPVHDSAEEVATRSSKRLTAAAVEALTKTHGILMIIAWPILAMTAIYFTAFMKPVLSKKGEWHYVHGSFMLCSATLTCISLVLIFIAHADSQVPGLVNLHLPLPLSHFILGIAVVAGQWLNIVLALSRCKPAAKFRWIYNILHGKVTGYVTSLLSLVNVAIGIYLFTGYSVAFGLFVVVTILGVAMFEVLHLLYNVLPRILNFCRTKDEQEQSLLSVNEKYADDEEDSKSVAGELKSVLAYTYRHHFGTLVLVLTVLVPINVAVCVFIAVH